MDSINNNIQMAEGKLGRVVVLRLKPGTDVLLGLQAACEEAGISNGVIVSAIGSLAHVRFCDPIEIAEKRARYGYGDPLQLDGPIELLSASGIICHDDSGATNLHVHVDLADQDGRAYGGHLVEGTKVLLTLDAVIGEIEGVDMCRKMDPELEVPLLSPQQL